MPRGRKPAATTSPEKPTPARRGRRAKEVDEIPAHLLKASDESSENSDNDSDYGSPKKGGRGKSATTPAARGRGRRGKEPAPVVEVTTPTTRPRRGRRGAAAKEPTPEQEQEPIDDQSQSTQEYSESTQSETVAEQQQQQPQHETSQIDESVSAAQVSEVSIEQDLHSNDQGPVHEQEEVDDNVVERRDDENVVDDVECEPEPAAAADDVVEVNEIMQIDDSSDESNSNQVQEQPAAPVVVPEVVAPAPAPAPVETPPKPARERITFSDKPVEKTVAQEPEKPVEVIAETRRSPTKANYRYPHMDAPMRSRSSSGEIREEPAKPAEAPPTPEEQPKKVEVEKSTRKRKWGPRKDDDDPVIAITTDSLKTIIADEVKPVPLADVKLLSPSPEREPEEKRQRVKLTAEDKDAKKKLLKERLRKQEEEEERRNEQLVKAIDKQQATATIAVTTTATANGSGMFKDRKVSIVMESDASAAVAPSPAKNESSNILYITNLVRPFTVLQLKSLLARTGKIVENGFWIDKIKSKCYVKYEKEE